MLSGANQTPVISYADGSSGIVVVELADNNMDGVTIYVDANADGTYETSEGLFGGNAATLVAVDAMVLPNSSIQANVKAVRSIIEDANGPETVLTSAVVTVTVEGVELLPIPPLDLDVHTETVWVDVDEADIVGDVQMVVKWDDGDWVEIGNPEGKLGLSSFGTPAESIGKDITVTTKHSLFGVDVYGPLATYYNQSIDEQLDGDPPDDGGTGAGTGGNGTGNGGPGGTGTGGTGTGGTGSGMGSGMGNGGTGAGNGGTGGNGASGNGTGGGTTQPPSNGGGSTSGFSGGYGGEYGDTDAIDEMMAGLNDNDDWYYPEGTQSDEDDYADFFAA